MWMSTPEQEAKLYGAGYSPSQRYRLWCAVKIKDNKSIGFEQNKKKHSFFADFPRSAMKRRRTALTPPEEGCSTFWRASEVWPRIEALWAVTRVTLPIKCH